MNICIVSREYPPETLWGGIGTFTYNLAHGLRNIGHNVDVIAFTLGEDSYVDDNGINIYRISSPRIPFIDRSLWELTKYALSPFAFFYSFKVKKQIELLDREKHYDVIDFPEHIGEGYPTIKSNKYPTLVRLYTPLSLIGHLGLQKATNSIDYYLFGLMEKSSIKKATIINSPSNNLAELVKDKFGISRDIQIIYNPIDTEKFSQKPRSTQDTSDILKVLFIGRLEDRKGAHILALAIPKVVEKFKKVKFIILGNDCLGVAGFKSMKDFMINIFEKNNVNEYVEFINRVPYEKLPDIYNQADISVVPSLYDNSPYTCLEAMSCGLPVIGTSAGGMPEYIDDRTNGIIIPPNDVDALVVALNDLLIDAKKRRLYGDKARDKSVRMFNREVVAKKITIIYLQAIDIFRKSNNG